MNKSNVIELPVDWADEDREYYLVPEGDYRVQVLRVLQEQDSRIVVALEILDNGPCASKKLFVSYTLSTVAGKRLFKEFLKAIDVQPEGTQLPVSKCRNKLLDVTVKHNTHDGKVYANVVSHRLCAA